MTSLNTKLVLSALGIALLATPAFAQRPHQTVSRQQISQPVAPTNAYPNPQTHSGSEQSRESGNETIGGF